MVLKLRYKYVIDVLKVYVGQESLIVMYILLMFRYEFLFVNKNTERNEWNIIEYRQRQIFSINWLNIFS